MRLLLDTHVFLWFISEDVRQPAVFRESIRDPDNTVFPSVVALWEATIKYQLDKLPLPESPATYFRHRFIYQSIQRRASSVKANNQPYGTPHSSI